MDFSTVLSQGGMWLVSSLYIYIYSSWPLWSRWISCDIIQLKSSWKIPCKAILSILTSSLCVLSIRIMNLPFIPFFFLLQLRALGAEGMVNEMIRHLQKAENLSVNSNMYLRTPTYNIVLHSLLEANEVSFHLSNSYFEAFIGPTFM